MWILLDMRGLLPRDEWGNRLAVINTEDVAFVIPVFDRYPRKSTGFDSNSGSQSLIELGNTNRKVQKRTD